MTMLRRTLPLPARAVLWGLAVVLSGAVLAHAQTVPNLPAAQAASPTDLIMIDQPDASTPTGWQSRRITPSVLLGEISLSPLSLAGNATNATGPATSVLLNSTLQFDGSGKLGIDLATPNTWTGGQAFPTQASTDNSTLAATDAWVKQFFPGLTTNVEATNVPGLDGAHWFIYNAPSILDTVDTLRVDRSPSYSGGTPGDTYSAIWGNCSVGNGVADYEWCAQFTLVNAATGGQNVALAAYATKLSGAGPTFGVNFNLTDTSGAADPSSGLTNEFDIAGNGTDANTQRIAANFVVSKYGSGADAHASAISFSPAASGIFDNGTIYRAGNYGVGENFSAGTFLVASLFLGPGQKIALDGSGTTYNRYLEYTAGTFEYVTEDGQAMQIGDAGNMTLKYSLVIGGGSAITSSGGGGVLMPQAFQSGAVASQTCTIDSGAVSGSKTLIYTNGILTGGTCNT
jgi:hypothetical protein